MTGKFYFPFLLDCIVVVWGISLVRKGSRKDWTCVNPRTVAYPSTRVSERACDLFSRLDLLYTQKNN